MFRSRFADAFNKNVPTLGPQDVETGVFSEEPSEQIELFLCALLGLVLNRKKYVEYGVLKCSIPCTWTLIRLLPADADTMDEH